MMDNKTEKMIPIWFWVGLVLTVYGTLIFGMGIYYVFEPEVKTATANLNPSLWWGAIMIVFGGLFLALAKFGKEE